jgi:hypothetical protein
VAVAFKVRIGDLLPEFLTDTAILLGMLEPTGTVAPGALQALPDGFYQFRVRVESNSHGSQTFFRFQSHPDFYLQYSIDSQKVCDKSENKKKSNSPQDLHRNVINYSENSTKKSIFLR